MASGEQRIVHTAIEAIGERFLSGAESEIASDDNSIWYQMSENHICGEMHVMVAIHP